MRFPCSAMVLCMIFMHAYPLFAQQSADQTLQSVLEQVYDQQASAEENDEAAEEWEDQLESYLQHPLDLNQATAEQLAVFPFLNTLQIQALLSYRRLLGAFTSVYELQAIPGWDISTIRQILPFVRVNENTGSSFSNATSPSFQWLSRYQRVIPRSWGYIKTTGSRYIGSPDAWLNKWQLRSTHFRAGLIAEKDAGEPFFRSFNSQGFDHIGFYLAYTGNTILRQAVVGDYEINMGQGLINWQSFSLNHSAYALQIEKNNMPLRAHTGTAENGYYRGIALQLQEHNWQQTCFVSLISPDVYWDSADGHRIITSWDETGYHRTSTENSHRHVLQLLSAGAQMRYRFSSGHVAVNSVYHHLSIPMQRRNQTYNQYAFAGDQLYNISLDYAWSVAMHHFFGEAAWSSNRRIAFLQGWMMPISKPISIGSLLRYYPKDYHTLYANGFSESGETANETGWYAATEMHWPRLQVYAYADLFHFPWWRYQISGPMTGTDDLCRIDWKMFTSASTTQQLTTQIRYRRRAKDLKTTEGKKPIPTDLWQYTLGWAYETPHWWLTLRGYANWFQQADTIHSRGLACYAEVRHQPWRRFYWDSRIAWFQVPDYEARIYTYERTVRYMFSLPYYYHKGWRGYLVLHYAAGRHVQMDLRWTTTWYSDQNQIGSGLDRIDGSLKHQFIIQMIWKM